MNRVITAASLAARIGTPEERPRDRYFAKRLTRWLLDWQWRQAQANGDLEALKRLSWEYEVLQAL